MPFVDELNGFRPPTGVAPTPEVTPQSEETFSAAFRQGNTLVSGLHFLNLPRFAAEEGYNPVDDLKARRPDVFYGQGDRFTGSTSSKQTDQIIGEIEREERDKKTLAASGWTGTVAGLAAGAVDPTMFLPVGALAKGAVAGERALQTAGSVAKLALLQSTAQEALLSGTQQTRTLSESAANIGSATLLGGLLGAGGHALLARDGLLEKGVKDMDAARDALSVHNGVAEPVHAAPGETGEAAPDAANSNLPPSEAVGRSIGAAVADTRDLSPTPYGLDSIPGVGKAVSKMFPNLDVLTNGSAPAKRAVTELSEVPLALNANVEGQTATRFGGPAIDREVKLIREGLHAQADDQMLQQWTSYLESQGQKPGTLQRMTGSGNGALSFDDFDAMVYDALSTGDQHPIPQVATVAQWMRKNGFDPIKERASAIDGFSETKLRPGETYAPRLWNKDKISAQWNDYVKTWTDHLEGEQTRKAQIQSDIGAHVERLNGVEDQVSKLDAMRERLTARQTELGGRLDEKAMEVARGEKRDNALGERQASIAEEVADTRRFIAEMRAEVRNPDLQQRLDSLEQEAAGLEKSASPVSEADLQAREDEELKSVLTGTTRKAAEILTGKRKAPKTPSFLSWIIKEGGIKVDSEGVGDVLSSLDPKSWHGQRIIKNEGGRTIEALADKIGEDFPGAHGEMDSNRGRPTGRQVLQWIDDAAHGREPDWFLEAHPNRDNLEAGRQAAMLDEMFSRAGVDVKTPRDVAAVLAGDRRAPVTLEDLDKIAADMAASGESVPLSFRREGVDQQIVATRGQIEDMRRQLADAIKARDAKAKRLAVAQARGDENAMAVNQAHGRLGLLQERMSKAEARQQLLDDALAAADQAKSDIRSKIEAKLEDWGGKSAKEALRAIESRGEAESLRDATRNIRAGAEIPMREAGRLTSADRAVDRATKRILGSDRDLSRQELRARAEEIASRQIGTPDGRLPYDTSETHGETGGPGASELRGHAARREIDIPYEMAKPWLDRSATQALKSYTHSVLPDAIIAERFDGDPSMTSAMKEIESHYAAQRAEAGDNEPAQKRLQAAMDNDIRIVAGMRDRIRGTYANDPQMRSLARISQNALKINNIISSHGMAVASLPDMAGVVFRHGFEGAFKDAWLPFINSMMDREAWQAVKAAGQEWKAYGIGIETQSASRNHALSDINENYRPTSKFERALSWVSDKAFLVNLLAPLTDIQKRMATNAVSHNILRMSQAVAEGKATAKDIQRLAEGNITQAQAAKIYEQFSNNGGANVKGILLPNTAGWTDAEARRAFVGAVARDVDIAVVQPGQEKPFFMSKPGYNVLGQYKAFSFASTQRILIANLQRRDAASLSGLITAVGMGMLAYRINTLASGQPVSDRPQDWIKEGINRGGILGVFDDVNSLAAKATGGKVDVYRAIGADKPLTRFVNRDAASMFLGPTYGKVQSLMQVSRAASNPSTWGESDTHALRMMTLGTNFPYLPRLFDHVEIGVNHALGIPMKARN